MTAQQGDIVELLPCPFCGRHMLIRTHSAFHPVGQISQCWLETAGEHGPYELDEDDYPSWNRRAPPTDAQVERAAEAMFAIYRTDNEPTWDTLRDSGQARWKAMTRVALQASREEGV
jgi:hypothetical protein